MTIEERIGLAQDSGNLSWGPHERQVDLVAAIGMASITPHTKMGALINRVIVNNDAKAFTDAKKLLTIWMLNKYPNKHMTQDTARRISYRALEEIVAPGCVKCTGTGVAIIDDKKVHCPACRGSGRHTYKAADRANAIGMKMDRYKEIGENWLEAAIGKAMASYHSVIRGTNKRR